LGAVLFIYLAWPGRINILLLGIDRAPPGTALGRSDTIIMSTVLPGVPEVSMLSVPRDLWVSIPGFGEDRVNAAHFFGEAEAAGSGPQLAMATIEQNFGVEMPYSIRIKFEGLKSFVDRLGGIPITLDQPVGKLPAGSHTLDGEMALAYVRDRSGTDDFTRLLRGQSFLRATLARLVQPAAWPGIPAAAVALFAGLDTNLPGWQVPRVVFTILRVGADGVRTFAMDRSMATGFTTEAGAQVLAPNWDRINPILLEVFDQ
jgi:LCP family protein required for cell wall assembly